MEELLKLLGFTTPLIYAGAAYRLFHWLDENASDEAKRALARTMSFKDYKSKQVASALVEVFDQIYKYPLLRWRPFLRSLLFTTVVSVIYYFEVILPSMPMDNQGYHHPMIPGWARWLRLMFFLFLFNAITDYLALFVIRPVLIRSGTKPVIGLVLGAVSGAAIVFAVNVVRLVAQQLVFPTLPGPLNLTHLIWTSLSTNSARLIFVWPAALVFVWLPLFALGIMTARLLTLLSWIVGGTQWFLKEGKERPLKAIGYVAAIVVFFGTVAARAAFSG